MHYEGLCSPISNHGTCTWLGSRNGYRTNLSAKIARDICNLKLKSADSRIRKWKTGKNCFYRRLNQGRTKLKVLFNDHEISLTDYYFVCLILLNLLSILARFRLCINLCYCMDSQGIKAGITRDVESYNWIDTSFWIFNFIRSIKYIVWYII
jgi:hypothetical protein